MPCSSASSPSRLTAAATYGVRRRPRGCAAVRASACSADTGGTRVARTAGTIAATSVTPMPTASEMTTVRPASTSPLEGRSSAASNSAPSSAAIPSPANSPSTDAATPMASASTATARRTCARVDPSDRSSANSRARCATVIENVLKMMKAPTSRAAPESVSSAGVRKLPMASLAASACSAASAAPVFTVTDARAARGASRRRGASGETPGSAATTMRDRSPGRWNQRWTSESCGTTSVAPPIDVPSPHSPMPEITTRCTPERVAQPDVLADPQALLVGLLAVDRRRRPAGAAARP